MRSCGVRSGSGTPRWRDLSGRVRGARSGGGLGRGALYGAEERELPQAPIEASSLGCGNPVALAILSAGEVVQDLGSGGGIDILLPAKRVAPGGKAYGLDRTDEMLELARQNPREAGVEN